jgi:RimJ/RimL family protein N-acetyltransferase
MTLRYALDRHELVADFVAQMIPHVRGHGFGKAIRAIGVVSEDGELIAGIVYHNYVPEAGIIEMSAAALPGHLWATRTTLKLMHRFPFLQCGCQMLFAKVLADNERMLRQFAAMNYGFIRLPRIFGRDRDGVLCCLTYEDWLESFLCRRYKHHIVSDNQIEEAA